MTQQELADSLGCSKCFVSFLESGKRRVPIEMCEHLSREFDFNPYVVHYLRTTKIRGKTNDMRKLAKSLLG